MKIVFTYKIQSIHNVTQRREVSMECPKCFVDSWEGESKGLWSLFFDLETWVGIDMNGYFLMVSRHCSCLWIFPSCTNKLREPMLQWADSKENV